MFKYYWVAEFKNKTIRQDKEDRYSKYNPEAEYNPSSFRDFKDYFDLHPNELLKFSLVSKGETYSVDFTKPNNPEIFVDRTSRYGSRTHTILHRQKRDISNCQPIYYRNMEVVATNGVFGEPRVMSYVIGYQGNLPDGSNTQKTFCVV